MKDLKRKILANARVYAGSNYFKNHFPKSYDDKYKGFVNGANFMLSVINDLNEAKKLTKEKKP
jgi:hypothetical protein